MTAEPGDERGTERERQRVAAGDERAAEGPRHGSSETYVYEALKAAIASGQLRPGEHLTETDIANRYNVSRTPVRAAVKVLEDQRLLTRVPGVGLTVTDLSVEQLDDIYTTRSVLMGLAARLAAQRMTPREHLKLQVLQDEMEALTAAGNFEDVVIVNDVFHDEIVAGSRSESLYSVLSQIHLSIIPFRHSTHLYKGRAEEAMREHRELIAAIVDRDEATAERIGRDHVVNAHLARLRQQAEREVELVRTRSGT